MRNKLTFMAKIITLILVCITFTIKVNANNVQISNVALSADTIQFDISWENSWRNTGTANSTENYDGVWVFVKYRDACDRTSSYPSAYSHVWLVNDTGTHVVPTTCRKEMGTNNIGGTDRALGIYLFRKADGTGTFTLNNVRLFWDQAAQGTSGGNWDIRVNAIEMVYVPGGKPFRLGGGHQTLNGQNTANFCNNATGLVPYQVASENAILMNQVGGCYTYSYATTGTLSANFPKGYDAYWIMKYEITQQQYVDYLNSLDRQEQINSTYIGAANLDGFGAITDATQTATSKWALYTGTVVAPYNPVFRQYICCPAAFTANLPVVFGVDADNDGIFGETVDGGNVSCNYLYWDNFRFLKKYLDWSALRPMTEFEYEKTCRGPIANVAYQANEGIWGLDVSAAGNRTCATGVSNAGQPDEIMTPSPATANNGSIIMGNAGIGGPARVGNMYQTGTTRVNAGSSFYGAADMGGNNWDFCWSFGLNPVWQSGFINPQMSRTDNGDGDVTTVFPAIWTNSSPYILRGGAWDQVCTSWQAMTISYRRPNGGVSYNNQDIGGRGARTSQ